MTQFPSATKVTLADRSSPWGTSIGGITLAVHEAGSGPPVVLCHGWPELAFSWRHQLPALATAGFRAIAPDQRGYGGSDQPEPVEVYDLEHLTSDLVGLLDALGIEKAVFVGHDWGGYVAWAMPVVYPERTAGVIGVNTPYAAFPTTRVLRNVFQDDEQLYILWFQEPGVAERVLEQRPRVLFEKLMRCGVPPEQTAARAAQAGSHAELFRRIGEFPPVGRELLTAEELDTYARAYEKSGFRGGINWYRNVDRNAERIPEIGTRRLEVPCLMITAEWDPFLPPSAAAGMPALCADLETHLISACGHWTQQEKPDALNRLMIAWLEQRFL